ncbi:carbohydrate-binding family 9-like protein [Mucisphaera calidilacus]|uniref:Carbohydrate-binding domain-containing protein n=1 Tax=Mucisphaera calidilacus TaxID=2527982 RepID=A0A518BZB6_9BACT|nr:carbohydrate-binding family 9-like protein [Mucisphaera calidilacus]QDU72305.1 hypothetical protein Pan265_21690 [Mucisphaera calidilacus]
MEDRPTCLVRRVKVAPDLEGHDDLWSRAEPVRLGHYHAKSSDHRPVVSARTLYDDEHLYIRFDVEDRYVIAVNTASNSPVYRDSCVEFFFQVRENHYINIEMNAIGAMLVGQGQEDSGRKHEIDPELIARIRRWTSLEGPIEEEIEEPVVWHGAIALPFALVEELEGPLGERRPAEGVSWRCNFYKCADRSSHPHWGMWSPIGEKLSFHQPKYFGHLKFV